MKKLIYCAAALATALFAGSCQQEMLDTPVGENTVTYTVELPEVQTKAVIGDGLNVDQLIYEVWVTVNPNERDLNGFIEGTTTPKAVRLYQDETSLVQLDNKRKAVVTFNLVQDQNYTILFWAQVARGEGEAAIYNTEDLTNVTYAGNVLPNSSDYFSNQEDYAAFYAAAFVKDSDSKSKSIKLKRPFAQLNIATENTVSHQSNSLYKVKINDSKVVLSNVATTFDVAQNLPDKTAVGGFSKFEFKTSDVPTTPSTLTVNGQTYEYVAMNYVFANGTTEVYYEIDATLTSEYAETTEARVTNIVPNVPLKENYRTNIVGNLITSTTDYYVEIDANWADNGVGYVEEVWDGKNVMEPKKNAKGEYEIHLATELAWVAAAVNGTIVDPAVKSTGYVNPKTFANETFVLMADIDLANTVWVPIGALGSFDGTFDGNDHFIRNLNVNVDSIIEKLPSVDNKVAKTIPVGLFGRCKGLVKNLHVNGASVVGHYKAAVVVGDALCGMVESCDVKNATVTATPYDNNYGQHVGVIAGYLAADGAEAHVKNCAVAEVTVSSYRDVAAIVGTATYDGGFAPIVTGNVVENAVVIADQTPEYGETKAANAGYFVGRKSSNAVVENNEYINVEVKVIGGSDSDIQTIINNAKEGDTIRIAGTYTLFPTINKVINVICDEGTTFNCSANLNINGATIKGATIRNAEGSIVNSGTVNGNYEDCTFEGKTVIRYGYADVATFNNCIFKETGGEWLFHFDDATGEGKIICNDCTFDGKRVAVAGGLSLLEMTNCRFNNGSYFNTYCNSNLTSCQFNTSVRPLGGNISYTDCDVYGDPLAIATLALYNGYNCTITIDGAVYTWNNGLLTDAENNVIVWSGSSFQNSLNRISDNNATILFANDIEGDVTIVQKPDTHVTINGNGKNFSGFITVDGKSATYMTAGLTIKDLNFMAESISADACVNLGESGDNNTRYTCNVTLENCKFDVPGAVGVKSYTGGDKNLTIKNCTATSNAHSLVQAKGIDGILVSGCTVNSKNGMNFNNSTNVTVDNCTTNVKGYAARFGESSGGTGAAEVYAIKNSTLKSACEDGDAVIMLRGTADYSTLNITNTTLEGAALVQNTATDAKVVIDGGDYVADGVTKKDGEYCVSNAVGLKYMHELLKNKKAGIGLVMNLTADIDYTGYTWTPVESHIDENSCISMINGNGHTISNLTINGQAMFTRFAGSGDVTIKDITFDNANVNSNSINTSILTVQTYQNVTLDNVDVKNSTIIGGYKVAPLIATVYNENPSKTITATLRNCDVTNTTVKATSYDFCTTGMVAFVYDGDNDKIEFENCTVSNVKLYAPNVYTAHAAIYTTGSETLYNEAEGVTVTNVTFENI